MYKYINENLQVLNRQTVNDLINNFTELLNKAQEMGKPVPTLKPFGTFEVETMLQSFNSIEDNIQVVHEVFADIDDNYKVFKWQVTARNKAKEVHRWFKWQNDIAKKIGL